MTKVLRDDSSYSAKKAMTKLCRSNSSAKEGASLKWVAGVAGVAGEEPSYS